MWTYPFKIKNENRIKASKKKNAKVRIQNKILMRRFYYTITT